MPKEIQKLQAYKNLISEIEEKMANNFTSTNIQ